MTYAQLKQLKPSGFKRRCGVHRETFEQMVEVLRPHLERRGKRGGQCKLSVEDQLLLVLEYGFEYRTQFHIATSWGLSQAAVCRLLQKVETLLMKSGKFRQQAQKAALPECLPVECRGGGCHRSSQLNAQKKQRTYYSGKKKRHTKKSASLSQSSQWANHLHGIWQRPRA